MIIIFGILIFTFVAIAAGYKLAIIRWQPKELINKLDKFADFNVELSDGIKKLNEINKQKDTWYLQQLNNLGFYMRDKYSDDYVFNQLKAQIPGYEKPKTETKKELKIDDILDKASKYGLNSLTEEEINYLKNRTNEN